MAVAVAIAVLGIAPAAAAQGTPDASGTDPAVAELVDRYVPEFRLAVDEVPCDDEGEPWQPSDVDMVLGNDSVLLRVVGEGSPVMAQAPTGGDIAGRGDGFFLDVPGISLSPGCTYEEDQDRFVGDTVPTVYAHVVEDPSHHRLAVEYWTWWYFNRWNNTHESDWEGIQVVFDVGTVAEALQAEPVEVGYAQHEGGERAAWGDDKLTRDGNHPVVWSSVGSHASYYDSAVMLGRSGAEGFGCDDTSNRTRTVAPTPVVMATTALADDGTATTEVADGADWVTYEGRWGEIHSGPFSGPTGPIDKDRFADPFAWQDSLRDSSVEIPAGEAGPDDVVDTFCTLVAAGSGLVATLQTNPLPLLLALVAIVGLVVVAVRRTSWHRRGVSPLRERRRAGEILRSAFSLYRTQPRLMAGLGLVYVPAAALAGLVGLASRESPGTGPAVELTGGGFSGLVLGGLLAGTVGLLATVFTTAAASAALDDLDHSRRATALSAYRRVAGRIGPLLEGSLRVAVVVMGLAITVVGLPWAIRQAVRYRFMPQQVLVEGSPAADSLRESSALVRGRWWHTAGMVVLFGATSSILSLLIGLLLLVAVSALPLWLFSMVSTLVSGLLAPIVGVSMTLLWGDATTDPRGGPAA